MLDFSTGFEFPTQNPITIDMDSEVTHIGEFIFHVKKLLPPELCKAIIEIHQNNPTKHHGREVTSQGEVKAYGNKDSLDSEVKKDGIWKPVFDEIHNRVGAMILEIVALSPALQVLPVQWTGYRIQQYEKNKGHFKWHFDALGNGAWSRQIAMIIYLNSVSEGGETCFLHQNLKVKPVIGDAIFFPPFWTHLHNGEIPKSEDKYIITSFVNFKIDAKDEKKSA